MLRQWPAVNVTTMAINIVLIKTRISCVTIYYYDMEYIVPSGKLGTTTNPTAADMVIVC